MCLSFKVSVAHGHSSERMVVGLVGYPNVGKSSTINALIGEKKVSVSATPGKTKHFQTIRLSPDVLLCDCPGLVFPQFAATKADLVCDGVLPIDQMREHTGPVDLITKRIPQEVLEGMYGLRIVTLPVSEGGSGTPTATEFLTSYASESALPFSYTFANFIFIHSRSKLPEVSLLVVKETLIPLEPLDLFSKIMSTENYFTVIPPLRLPQTVSMQN